MSQYDYTKTPLSIDRLTQEIQQSTIVTALDHMTALGSALSIFFKADLSSDDQTTLSTLVTAHTGVPLPQNIVDNVAIVTQPDPAPFAIPSYRTKRDAISDLISIEKNTVGDIDFKLTAERYVSGGDIIIENAEIGDYVIAMVEDIDGVIPSPYRAALCEAWPIVATYISKAFVTVKVPGSIQAGSITTQIIDTYPLNAKISAGLYLCIEYHAIDSGLTRRIGINYHLTKKL